MSKMGLYLLLAIVLAGCVDQRKRDLVNQEKKVLERIRYVHGEPQYNPTTHKYDFVTADFLLDNIGAPDVEYTFDEWVCFINTNNKIPDNRRQNEIDTVKWKIQKATECGLNIEDDSDVNVWVYMPNHHVEVVFWRFLLPPIKTGLFSRPAFILFGDYVIGQAGYLESK